MPRLADLNTLGGEPPATHRALTAGRGHREHHPLPGGDPLPAALHDNTDTATCTIDSIGAPAEDAELLRVPEGTPLLRVRRRAFTTDGTPIESSDDRYLHTKASFTLNSTRNSPSGLSMISG